MHTPVDVDVFGTSNFVAPLLRAGIHARVEIGVIEHNRVRIEHMAQGRAATIGQDGTEELSVAVERLHLILRGGTIAKEFSARGHLRSYTCKCNR